MEAVLVVYLESKTSHTMNISWEVIASPVWIPQSCNYRELNSATQSARKRSQNLFLGEIADLEYLEDKPRKGRNSVRSCF